MCNIFFAVLQYFLSFFLFFFLFPDKMNFLSEWNFGRGLGGLEPISFFICSLWEFMSLFEAGRGRLSVNSSLLLNTQYSLVGPLVCLCSCSSRCDIHPVTADTAESTSESTTGTKNAFWGQKYPRGHLQHAFPVREESPIKYNTSEST